MSQSEAPYGTSGWVAGLLIPKLQSTNPWFAEAAESELAWLGDDAIPTLRQLLEAGDWSLRWRAARVLGRLEHPDVIPLLLQAYPGGSEILRLEIVRIIASRAAPETVPFLREALHDPWPNVRRAAAQGLAYQATVAPAAQLRAVLPHLRALTAGWRLETADSERRECRMAIECIEAATAATSHLPIPAAPAAADSRDLPLPAAPPEAGAP